MSSPELKSIINQLDLIFDKDPWYGDSMISILESVNPEWAFKPPVRGIHSIAELVSHLTTWKEFALKRLSGDNEFMPDQKESFDWKRQFPDKTTAWNFLKERFISVHQNLLSLLRQSDDALLDQMVPGKPYTFRYLLNGVIQHDLYHIGQISMVRRIQEEKYLPEPGIFRHAYKIFPFEGMSRQK